MVKGLAHSLKHCKPKCKHTERQTHFSSPCASSCHFQFTLTISHSGSSLVPFTNPYALQMHTRLRDLDYAISISVCVSIDDANLKRGNTHNELCAVLKIKKIG